MWRYQQCLCPIVSIKFQCPLETFILFSVLFTAFLYLVGVCCFFPFALFFVNAAPILSNWWRYFLHLKVFCLFFIDLSRMQYVDLSGWHDNKNCWWCCYLQNIRYYISPVTSKYWLQVISPSPRLTCGWQEKRDRPSNRSITMQSQQGSSQNKTLNCGKSHIQFLKCIQWCLFTFSPPSF